MDILMEAIWLVQRFWKGKNDKPLEILKTQMIRIY